MTTLKESRNLNRITVWAAAVLLLLCFYMLWPVNFYLAESLKNSYYMIAVPLLVGGVLYFRRFRDGLEFKLLVGYWLWFWFTRVLNGSPALNYDFQITVDLALMIPFFGLGLAMNTVRRKRFLNWLSAVVGGYHFLLGLLCLLAFLQRRVFINPITEGSIGLHASTYFSRIDVFDTHPNVTAFWFLMALFLMIYQFFACRNPLWRIPIVLSAVVDFFVISITYSRSVRVSVALAFGLLLVILLNRGIRKGWAARLTLLLTGFILTFALTYWASGAGAICLSRLSDALYPNEPASVSAESAGALQTRSASPVKPVALSASSLSSGTQVWERNDPRQWNGSLNDFSSNRLAIWTSAWEAVKEQPDVLLRGRLIKDVMAVSNTYLFFDAAHFHNSVIQILMTTGIPGLILAAALILLLLYHGLRLLFSNGPQATIPAKTLVLPVISSLVHFLLEAGLFTVCDVRTLFYFLLCGFALGFARDAKA